MWLVAAIEENHLAMAWPSFRIMYYTLIEMKIPRNGVHNRMNWWRENPKMGKNKYTFSYIIWFRERVFISYSFKNCFTWINELGSLMEWEKSDRKNSVVLNLFLWWLVFCSNIELVLCVSFIYSQNLESYFDVSIVCHIWKSPSYYRLSFQHSLSTFLFPSFFFGSE